MDLSVLDSTLDCANPTDEQVESLVIESECSRNGILLQKKKKKKKKKRKKRKKKKKKKKNIA